MIINVLGVTGGKLQERERESGGNANMTRCFLFCQKLSVSAAAFLRGPKFPPFDVNLFCGSPLSFVGHLPKLLVKYLSFCCVLESTLKKQF